MLFCMMVCLLSGTLRGAENSARKVVRVPYTHFERLMVVDENNKPVSGYAFDYIQMVGTYAGWDIEYVPCDSFSDCAEKLLAGEVDLFYDISYTEERAKRILYPDEAMGNEYYYLYALDGNTSVTPGNHASMNGKTVGTTSGTITTELLKQWCQKKNVEFKIIEYDSIPEKEADLYAGKIDLDLEVSMMAKRNLSAIEKIGTSAYYLVANKERQDLIDDINSALDKVIGNDIFYLTRLEERYFSDTVLSHTLTDEEKNWIADHEALRIGYFDKYLPFSTKDGNGEPSGAGIEAIKEIVKRLNLKDLLDVEFICFDDQEEGYRAVESGEIDLMFPAYISSSVRQDYRIMGGKILATLTSDLAFLNDIGDGKGKRIGVNKSNMMQYYYSRDSFPDSGIVFYDDIRGCLDGLLSGTSDGTFLNGLRSEALLKPGKYHSIRTVRAKNGFTFRMAFADGNIGLMLLMNRGLTMLDPDFINKTSYSYAGKIYTYSIMDFLREHVRLAIVLVAVLAALTTRLVGVRISNHKLAGINRQLQEHTETIERQRQQLEKKQDELEDALQMAQDANRAKTAFLSNMSHDIRTPMNAIIGFTGLAASHIDDKERVQDYLSTIAQSSEHLLSLINDVLEMSRIESGKMNLNEKEESLPDIVHAIRNIVQADVRAKQLSFLIDTADVRNDFVFCDKLRLNQVLLNLISNAIKYTHPGGTIALRIIQKASPQAGRGAFEFHVKDNGIGMSEEFIETIFDPFTREENSTVSRIQGTGLGMAITRNIVEMMGGRISVASKKGEGSEFTVSVDFRLSDRKASDREKTGQTNREERTVLLEGKKVLLVDDNELNLKIGTLQLQQKGMIVDAVRNGQLAVDTIRENGIDAYDFVLMDIQMPVMDGYEATSIIRKLPEGDKLKIIAFSANAFEEDKEKSLKAGMDGHIAKPLKINELINELKRFCV
jgi:signal transduction histidine kinase/ActR/RegA family two-component response regulator